MVLNNQSLPLMVIYSIASFHIAPELGYCFSSLFIGKLYTGLHSRVLCQVQHVPFCNEKSPSGIQQERIILIHLWFIVDITLINICCLSASWDRRTTHP